MVALELELLFEIGCLRYHSKEIIESLSNTIDLKISNQPFDQIALKSTYQNFTRDPFDRIIVADADLKQAKLISKDRKILQNYPLSVW